MADIYKIIAGTLVFVLFVTGALFMVSTTFADLAPVGASPQNLQNITTPKLPFDPTKNNCDPGFLGLGSIPCALASFFGPIINGLAYAWGMFGGFFGIMINVFTFNIPAFQEMGTFGIFFRVLLTMPMVIVMAVLVYFIVKSAIPTVGGNAE